MSYLSNVRLAQIKMKGIYKECRGNAAPKYIIDRAADLPPLSRYSVLIEVKACALSEVDDKLLQLVSRDTSSGRLSIGKDIAGVVRGVGNAVSTVKIGDEVVGIVPLDYGFSGCAEFVIMHEFDITKKPDELSFVEAATIIGDAVRAYTALHYLGRLSSGDTVLVMDGASSFGSLCIQLAYHWGAKVIASVSSDEEKHYLEDMGNQIALIIDLRTKSIPYCSANYRNRNSELVWSACMEESGGLGVDLIVDNGVSLFPNNEYRLLTGEDHSYPLPSKHEIISALSVGGRWITSKPKLQLDPENSNLLFLKCASIGFLFEHAWTLSSTQQGQYQHILMDIMEKAADGIIKSNVHSTVGFEAVPETMKKLPNVRVGKIVLKME